MMLRLKLWFTSLLLLCSACQHHPQSVATSTKALGYHPVWSHRSHDAFETLLVRGRMDLTVHTGYRKPGVDIWGDPNDLKQIIVKLRHGTLLIDLGKGFPRQGPVKVVVRAGALRNLDYKGAGYIYAPSLSAKLMNIRIHNNGRAVLKGPMYLHILRLSGSGLTEIDGARGYQTDIGLSGRVQLHLKGNLDARVVRLRDNTSFNAYWLKSPSLNLRMYDKSCAQLAGAVGHLDVVLNEKAVLKARYLRSKELFVKTFGHSLAEIAAVKSQHTLASDQSDIHFYNLAQMSADFMAFDGAVLDMRDWRLYSKEPYTNLNSP